MKKHNGFTLVEILIVLVIMALLVAILLPVLTNSKRKAHATSCLTSVHQMSVKLHAYLADYDGEFPFDQALPGLLNRKQFAACPSAGENEAKSEAVPGYAFNGQLAGLWPVAPTMNESEVLFPATTVTIAEVANSRYVTGWIGKQDRGRRHNGGANFAFCDGHAKWHPSDAVLTIEDDNDGHNPSFSPVRAGWVNEVVEPAPSAK